MTREEIRRERDRKLIRTMARHGIVDPRTTLRVARRVNRERGHMPLSRACALLEKESGGGANVWGHDKDRHGQIPPFGGRVTRASYAEYLRRRRKDGRQQGCGPTQLTFFGFQDEADRHGGCWRPNINMYVGFTHLAMNIKANGAHAGMKSYNGSGPAAEAYAHDLRAREARWRATFKAAVGSKQVAHGSRRPLQRPAPRPGGVGASPAKVGGPTKPGASPAKAVGAKPGASPARTVGAKPGTSDLLVLLERLDARGDRAREALIERRRELERALEHERTMRGKIEAELGSAIPPVGAQPPPQPSRLIEDMLIDVRSRVESALERERQERMSADAELRAALGVNEAAGNSSAEEATQPPESEVPMSVGAVGPAAGMTLASNGASSGSPAGPGRAGNGNGKVPGSTPSPTVPGAGSGGGQAGVPGAPGPDVRPSLEELAQRLAELDAEGDRIRALLHQGYEDLEGRVIRERRARRGAQAQLRSARGLGPEAPPRRGARRKLDVKHPDVLRARAHGGHRGAKAPGHQRPSAGVDKRWSKNRVPHRRLVEGSRGLDVAQLQHALNHRLKARSEFGYKPVQADGEFGPATRKAWVAMARAIGLPHGKCTVGNQLLMRNPAKRGPSMVKKGRAWLARARAARKREQMTGGAGAKAAAFLVKRAGWSEHPAGSNDAPFLAHWRRALKMGWMRGQPWCGFACQAAYHYGANKTLPADTPSTIAIANRARSGNGYARVGLESIKAGDLVVFHMGSGGPKHVGLARGPMRNGVVPTVEGNTSAGNTGSQSNGGGIFLRSRSRGLIHTVARPK